MKPVTFFAGLALGMAAATAIVAGVYPDVPRRMMRDGKRAVRCTKKMAQNMFS